MNVEIQKNGVLRITAESETEAYALQKWMENATVINPFDNGVKMLYNSNLFKICESES